MMRTALIAGALGVYGTLSKHLGLPLRFPGKRGAYECMYQFADALHMAKGMVRAATTEACANQACNYYRWRYCALAQH